MTDKEKKPISKAQQKAVNNYIRNHYDSLRIVVPAGMKARIAAYAKSHGTSINGLVNDLLRSAMDITTEEWKASAGEAQKQD